MKNTKDIFLLFIVWRIFLFILAFLAPQFLPWRPRFPYWETVLMDTDLPPWVWSFANFDGVHYLTIAKQGYSQYQQAFFPLYPLLIKWFGNLWGGGYKFYLLSGLLISNLAFFVSLMFLNKLIQMDFSAKVAQWTLIFLLAFPTSYYFGAVYTESLFLLLVLAAFYFARIGKWSLAGILGAFASTARLFGIFLVPALLVEWYKHNKLQATSYGSTVLSSPSKDKLQALWLLLIPSGLLLYMYYLLKTTGDPLYFINVQPVFGAERTSGQIVLLPQVFYRYLKIFLTVSMNNPIFYPSLQELAMTVIFTFLTILVFFRLPLSWAVFMFLSFITPTLTGSLSSMPRYVLILFPGFVLLAMIKSKLIKLLLLVVSCILLAVNIILFAQGWWVA